MKKGRDMESMLGEFHRADFAPISDASDPNPRGFETRYVLGIYAVITIVTSFDDVHSIDGAQPGTGQ